MLETNGNTLVGERCGGRTHHVLLRGVFVALEYPDAVPAAHTLNLLHRLASKLLQGDGPLRLPLCTEDTEAARKPP